MSNMSYCRFQNTLGDLRDCESALSEMLEGVDPLSADELDAAIRLCKSAARISALVLQRGVDDRSLPALITDPDEAINALDELAEKTVIKDLLTRRNAIARELSDEEKEARS